MVTKAVLFSVWCATESYPDLGAYASLGAANRACIEAEMCFDCPGKVLSTATDAGVLNAGILRGNHYYSTRLAAHHELINLLHFDRLHDVIWAASTGEWPAFN